MRSTKSPVRKPISHQHKWAISRSGKVRICLNRVRHAGTGWAVSLYDGTGWDRKVFATEDEAKAAANAAWRTK